MQNDHTVSIPEHIPGAAFLVEDRTVTQVNAAAEQRQIPVGANIRELICVGSQEYDSFSSGKLYLQLNVAGIRYDACVTPHQGVHLFCISSDYESAELQILARAASHLRESLQNALIGADRLSGSIPDSADSSTRKSLGQVNRSLHQMLRSVGNMSDASKFPRHRLEHFVCSDAKALFAEIAEKVHTKVDPLNRTIIFTGLNKQVFTMMDAPALERAFYNLINNAVKFSPEGSTIRAKVSTAGNRLYITVENTCTAASSQAAQFFDRYLREPGLEDRRFGIGLGLSVVRNIAIAHHGTFLVSKPNKNTVRCTMTLAVLAESHPVLNSSCRLKIDYSGGMDTALVELSDILPDEMYENI